MRQLALNLDKASYNIYIEEGLISSNPLIGDYCDGESVLFLSNETIAPLFLEKLKTNFPNKTLHHFLLPDGESYKNIDSYTLVLDYLIEKGFRRNDTLVALGGGVIGDLGGFVAACYQRGMGFIQVPTSLLAQVDSSVGGKTAVNHRSGKNMIGAFYQPKAVFIDTQSLLTLPEKEYASGFAEVVKYAMLGSTEIKRLLSENLEEIRNREKKVLSELIYYSCQMKAAIVSQDEKEHGKRALLNLGHTFGHAIEKVTSYRAYLHGEAVSIGTVMAMNLAIAKGLIKQTTYDFFIKLLVDLQLPVRVSKPMLVDDIINAMKLDKKNLNQRYRLILPRDNDCIIVEEDELELIGQAIGRQLD